MRAQVELRLTLTEQETTDIAVAAFHAKLPIIEWVKKQLLIASSMSTWGAPAPTVAPVPSVAPPDPSVAPPDPSVAPVPAASVAPSETALPIPMPAAPVVQVTHPTQLIEPLKQQPATPAAKVSEAEKRPRASRIASSKKNTPRGFYAILELAEKIDIGRRKIAAEVGTNRGIKYVTRMGEWYRQEGIKDFDQSIRNYLIEIGQHSEEYMRWFRLQRPGSVRADIMPHQLIRALKDWVAEHGPPAASEPTTSSSVATPEAEVVPATDPFRDETTTDETTTNETTTDETLIFSSGGGIKRQSLHEFLAKAGPPNGQTTMPPPEIVTNTSTPTRWDNFQKVSFLELNAYDARVLRRFAAEVVNQGGAKNTLVDAKIATMIRNIRGQESGDNPPCAEALRRMGVILGISGTFRLRPEFIARFNEVRVWAEV